MQINIPSNMLDQVHMTSLFENATEGIILTNGKGVIVVANPAAEIMFGYSKNELVNQPIEVLIPEKFKSVHHEHREGFYKKPSNRTMGHGRDLYGRKMDGSELPVEISLSHYERDSETFVIAFIVDITGRKQIENRMLQQKAELDYVIYDTHICCYGIYTRQKLAVDSGNIYRAGSSRISGRSANRGHHCIILWYVADGKTRSDRQKPFCSRDLRQYKCDPHRQDRHTD